MTPRQRLPPAATPAAAAPCPCGLPQPLAACCGRWMAGPLHLQAPDALRLMRSRYSAFVGEQADYLRQTLGSQSDELRLQLEGSR